MIYTVGKKEVYEPYLATHTVPQKAIGGTVWPTYEEVRAYLVQFPQQGDYEIYGVEANWETDVRPDNNDFFALTKHAKLVKLDKG